MIVFTDLDGTLLDENYRWDRAKDAIERLKGKVPVVFCSAKTRKEQRRLREEMGIKDPYIVEDGSAIVVPVESELSTIAEKLGERVEDEIIIKLGVDYEDIVDFLRELKKKHDIEFYGDMSCEEVSKVTGLKPEMAKLAKEREFSETVVRWSDEALREIEKKFEARIGGRFLHVYGRGADKGKAVRILTEMYEELWGKKPLTVGIGNHYTDLPMLKAVDVPAIVKNPEGWIDVDFPVYKAKGVATEGWVEVVERFVLKRN